MQPVDQHDVGLRHGHRVVGLWLIDMRVAIGADELAWSVAEPWGTTPVPELYVRELDRSAQTVRVRAGQEVLPGVVCHDAPGHTPGHLIFTLAGEDRDVIFTGDAAKNRAEILSLSADMTYDPAVSRRSMEHIWEVWRRRPGSVLIPGHDMPMVLEGGAPRYLRAQAAAISAWFGESLDETKVFELTA